jgi:hypothetical protein
MGFRKLLEESHSKANATIVLIEVACSSKKIEDLMIFFAVPIKLNKE